MVADEFSMMTRRFQALRSTGVSRYIQPTTLGARKQPEQVNGVEHGGTQWLVISVALFRDVEKYI
jgi:hypothetical protein